LIWGFSCPQFGFQNSISEKPALISHPNVTEKSRYWNNKPVLLDRLSENAAHAQDGQALVLSASARGSELNHLLRHTKKTKTLFGMRVSWFVPFRAGCQPYWLLALLAALFGVRPLNADHHPILNGLATFPDNQRGRNTL
jgi:hypothetical protein